MNGIAYFTFHDSLQDFLLAAKKNKSIAYTFKGTPAIKDAIEAIGIPHPEVDVIIINNAPVGLEQLLYPQDVVAVFPKFTQPPWPKTYSLQAHYTARQKFILDVHLGKLARVLRLLGFDTYYENTYADKTIAQLAASENRIVLTRDIGLLKHKSIIHGYWLRSQHPYEQLKEVTYYYNLASQIQPFTRCLACNGCIGTIAKEKIIEQIPPKTKEYFYKFYQCSNCKRIYWEGSHYERMQEFIQNFTSSNINL